MPQRLRTSLVATAIGACTLSIVGCDSDSSRGETGAIRGWIEPAADLPIASPTPEIGDTTAIFVLFDVVSFHMVGDERWRSETVSGGYIDLVNPSALPMMLAMWELPEGHYDRMRFHVQHASLILGDLYFPLSIGGDGSTIEIEADFCVTAGGDVDELELEWDATDGLRHGRGGYWLDPRIEVHSAPTCTDDLKSG